MPRVGEALKMLDLAPHVSGMGVHASSLGSGHYKESFVPKYYCDLAKFQASQQGTLFYDITRF